MKFKLNDNLYTIIGVLVVIGGIAVFLFTSGIFNKNDDKLENNKPNNNEEVTDSPANDETNTTEKDPVKDESTNTDKNTTNNSQANTNDNQGTTSTADILSCTMTTEEEASEGKTMKTVATCQHEFKNGYLHMQNCVGTVTSSDKQLLQQYYQLMSYMENEEDSVEIKAAETRKLVYENDKIVLTSITDVAKMEAAVKKYNEDPKNNTSEYTSTIEYGFSAKDTKEDVRKKQVAEGYTCK